MLYIYISVLTLILIIKILMPMKIRNLLISLLLLFTVGLFAVDTGPPVMLDVDITDVEFSISDNTQMENVVIDQFTTVYMFTGEGIVLEYSMDVANDTDMLSEASNVQLNSFDEFYVSNCGYSLNINKWALPNQLDQLRNKEDNLNMGLFRTGVGVVAIQNSIWESLISSNHKNTG